jgi:hypothetical protein
MKNRTQSLQTRIRTRNRKSGIGRILQDEADLSRKKAATEEPKRRFKWTKRRKISAFLFIVWILWLAVTWAIPVDAYGKYVFSITLNYDVPLTENFEGFRPVSYWAKVTLSTNGLWSAYNTIHVKATIHDVNITDFTHDYHDLGFTNMSVIGNLLTLSPQPDGTFTTEGDIQFPTEVDTWVYLIPTSPTGYVNLSAILSPSEFKQVTSQPRVAHIGPQSDTLMVQFNQFAVKVGFILGSFSILFLQPIIEGIFIKQKEDDEPRGD